MSDQRINSLSLAPHSLTDSQRSVGGSGAPQQPPTDSRNATLNTALLGHRTSRSIEYIETRHRHGHRTSSYTPNRRCVHDTNDTHASDHTRNDTHASHGKRKAAAPRRRAWSLVLHTKKQRAQRRPREEKREEEEEGVTQREHHTEGARVRARGRERVCVREWREARRVLPAAAARNTSGEED